MSDTRRGIIRLLCVEVNDGCDTIGGNLSLKDDQVSSVKQIEMLMNVGKSIHHNG